MSEKYYDIKPFGATPSYRQMEHLKMGKKAFFHFGVNTFSNNEWGDGKESARIFDPTDLNIRSWIRDIKAAGFKLAIITAKHHDGFCLWPSAYTEHSVKNSPYKGGKGDIIREFTDACHEFGIKVGIYISPWDRNSPYWGTPDYSIYYAKQLEEIVTQYGKIDEIWWDGAGSLEAKYDWGLWAYIVRNNQPDAVIFGSMGATPYAEMRWVGNEAGFAGKTHYASVCSDMMFIEDVTHINTGMIGADRYIPAEVDVSIRPGWFYHKDQDDKVKSSRKLDDIWFRSVGNNAIMLLNFPPDRTGNIVRRDVLNAIESNRRIEKMLSLNLLDNARVSADTRYRSETCISMAMYADDDLFYASDEDKNTATISIKLDNDSPEFNTIILGEKVELGERITSFKLESMDNDDPEILYEGTSVGYLRAVRFKKGAYKKLRLTLEGITAPITLRYLSLNIYDEDVSEEALSMQRVNLAAIDGSQVNISEDRKTAQIMFGGIYPFDTISFRGRWHGGKYKAYAFDGSKYYLIAEGVTEEYDQVIRLAEPILTSYQVKIEYEREFAIEPDFKVL